MSKPTPEQLNAELEVIRQRVMIAYMPEHYTDEQQIELLERMITLRRVELGLPHDPPLVQAPRVLPGPPGAGRGCVPANFPRL